MAKNPKTKLELLMERLKSIKAEDIMTKNVITATENTYLSDVAETMIRFRISGLPVIGKDGRVIGIITSDDLFLVMEMIESGDLVENGRIQASKSTVRFAMSTEVVKIKKNTNLARIIALMRYKNVHTLPVFEGNRMVGVIGRRDVYKNFYSVIKDL